MDVVQQESFYTYEDWLKLDENIRAELVDGKIYMMAAPSRRHQSALSALHGQFWTFLRNKPCRVYPAPFSVRLNKDENTVFEPDIVVVCDHSKLNDRGCEGAPDLIVEVLSPSTSGYDKYTKFYAYLRAGVREYWIVDPEDRTLTVHLLQDGVYVTDVYIIGGNIEVKTLPGCEINLEEVFQD